MMLRLGFLLLCCWATITNVFPQKQTQPIWSNSYESAIESSDSLTKKGKKLGITMQDLGVELPSSWDIFNNKILDTISFPCLLHTFSGKNTFLVANRFSSFCAEDIIFKTKKEKENAQKTFLIREMDVYYLGIFEKNAQTNKPTGVKNMYTEFFNACVYKDEVILVAFQKIDTNFSVFEQGCSEQSINYWSDYQSNLNMYLYKINAEGIAWEAFVVGEKAPNLDISGLNTYFQDSILWVSFLETQFLKTINKYKVYLHAYNLENGALLKKICLDSFLHSKSENVYVKNMDSEGDKPLLFFFQNSKNKIYQVIQKDFRNTSRRSKKELIESSLDNKIQKYFEPKLPVGYAILLKKIPKNAPLPSNFEPQFWRGQAERAGGSLQMVEFAGQICYFAGTWALEKDRDKAFETLKIEFPEAEKIRVEDWKPILDK